MTVCVLQENINNGEYYALVRCYGHEYAVMYINKEIRVYGTNGKNPVHKYEPKWKVDARIKEVKDFAINRIIDQGEVFQKQHNEIYNA